MQYLQNYIDIRNRDTMHVYVDDALMCVLCVCVRACVRACVHVCMRGVPLYVCKQEPSVIRSALGGTLHKENNANIILCQMQDQMLHPLFSVFKYIGFVQMAIFMKT